MAISASVNGDCLLVQQLVRSYTRKRVLLAGIPYAAALRCLGMFYYGVSGGSVLPLFRKSSRGTLQRVATASLTPRKASKILEAEASLPTIIDY